MKLSVMPITGLMDNLKELFDNDMAVPSKEKERYKNMTVIVTGGAGLYWLQLYLL